MKYKLVDKSIKCYNQSRSIKLNIYRGYARILHNY